MSSLTTPNKRHAALACFILGVALVYPAWQAGQWLANNLWASIEAQTRDQVKRMTLVVGPMLPITIDGMTVHALGTDICPGQESKSIRVLFGESANAGMPQCIVVTPTTEKVRVSLLGNGSLGKTEEWTVQRDADRTSFRRPNGAFVITAEK